MKTPDVIEQSRTANGGSQQRVVRHVTCVNLKITVEADPRMPEGEIQCLINDALSEVVIDRERWTTFGKMHITGKVPNDQAERPPMKTPDSQQTPKAVRSGAWLGMAINNTLK